MASDHSPRESRLWQEAFGEGAFASQATARDRFADAFNEARANAELLGGEIAVNLPNFTRHDLSHLDALWSLADTIVGEEVGLNPAEAFVLGVSFLVHDLAMSKAAYVVTGVNLRDDPKWADALGIRLRREFGRPPIPAELASPPAGLAAEVESELIRELHAEQASRLPGGSWKRQDGSTEYFVADAELRSAYGTLIGLIASSHHWDHDLLVDRLSGPKGAPVFAPQEWVVDPLRIACILRLADASHIDAGRAPDILAAVRKLEGLSQVHWGFQSKMQRPYRSEDRLVFTSAEFSADEIDQWWLAHDTLRMIDSELKRVDALLADQHRPRFQIRGVAHVESPRSLQTRLPCSGWEPVAAQVQVSDVATLIRRLGGTELYGERPVVALRELLSNAIDAVRARDALASFNGRVSSRGRISVRWEGIGDNFFLSVSDNGIGMSHAVLTSALLDFGKSSWLGPDVVADNPGLAASSFSPTGRYGIGFFSVFMLGSRVEVISRTRRAALEDTWVLAFGDDLNGRAILRRANVAEQLDEPGTLVRVAVDERYVADGVPVIPEYEYELSQKSEGVRNELHDLVQHLVPASDVDIWVSDQIDREFKLAVQSDDWMTIPGEALMSRILGLPATGQSRGQFDRSDLAAATRYGPRLQLVHNSQGEAVGRVCLRDDYADHESDWVRSGRSVVTAGVARSDSSIFGLAGILLGKPARAARDSATPVWETSQATSWATAEVAKLAASDKNKGGEGLRDLALMLSALSVDVAELRIWNTARGWLNSMEVVERIRRATAIRVLESYDEEVQLGDRSAPVLLHEDVVVVDSDRYTAWWRSPGHGDGDDRHGPLTRVFLACVAEAWDLELAPLLSNYDSEATSRTGPIGSCEGIEIEAQYQFLEQSSLSVEHSA